MVGNGDFLPITNFGSASIPTASAFGASPPAPTGLCVPRVRTDGVCAESSVKAQRATTHSPGRKLTWSRYLSLAVRLTTSVFCLTTLPYLIRSWLEAAENLAYPVSLQRALGQAFGYTDTEAFKNDVEQFSLLRKGTSARRGSCQKKHALTAR